MKILLFILGWNRTMTLPERLFWYLIRWQLSTPILAFVLEWLSHLSTYQSTTIANLIGGLIFFPFDTFIFKRRFKEPQWEISEHTKCFDCLIEARCYNLVEWGKINHRKIAPIWRCERCSTSYFHLLEEQLFHRDELNC